MNYFSNKDLIFSIYLSYTDIPFCLESRDYGLLMLLHRLMGELRGCQDTHRLQSQIPEISLPKH